MQITGKGSRESYHAENEQIDLMDIDWQLAEPLTVDAEIDHEGKFLALRGEARTVVAFHGAGSGQFRPCSSFSSCSCFRSFTWCYTHSLHLLSFLQFRQNG